MQAMLSKDHVQSENERFLRFSQGAFSALCEGKATGFVKTPPYKAVEEISITDFYSEDSFLFVIYEESLGNITNFSIEDYIPCLFKYGFYLQFAGRDPQYVIKEGKNEHFEQLEKRIYIEATAPPLLSNAFIRALLVETLPYEDDALLTFFYQYQIIELLIERVLHERQKKFATRIATVMTNSSLLRDEFDAFQKDITEKNRIKRLFANHLEAPPDLTALKSASNAFLRINSQDPSEFQELHDFAEFLYPIRNMLFHNLRAVNDPGGNVALIGAALKPVICDILKSYKD